MDGCPQLLLLLNPLLLAVGGGERDDEIPNELLRLVLLLWA